MARTGTFDNNDDIVGDTLGRLQSILNNGSLEHDQYLDEHEQAVLDAIMLIKHVRWVDQPPLTKEQIGEEDDE